LLDFTVDGLTIALVLLSALLHASWNALTKAGGDPLVSITIISATGGLCGIPLLLVSPFPDAETWRWLLVSACIHYLYQLSLVRIYRLGDLSQVYPIARGLAPVGVATLAAIGAGERLESGQLVGLACASVAIVSLGTSRSPGTSRRHAVGAALFTAALIGSYTYTDGRGVRSVESPEHFIGWSFVLASVPLVITTIHIRRAAGLGPWRRLGAAAIGGGLMATGGYAIALWAMSRAPMAAIAALRESSVLFAAIIGTALLGEAFGVRRVASALLLVVGLFLVQVRWG
jgi:drug/metabolite transporter (DMT)-like permease